MHLLINGLSARLGGGQTYLYQLLHHAPADWRITLLTSGGIAAASIPAHVQHYPMPKLTNPFRRAWWERTQLERFASAQGCDAILNPACLLPRMRSRIKTVVTFQNMLPFDLTQRQRYPRFSYRRLRDWLLERAMGSAMRRADLVIFISRFARDAIHARGIYPKCETLISHALDAFFLAANDGTTPPLPSNFPLKDEPYFLYVSFIDHYKCQRELLRVYAALCAQHSITTKFVLVGTGYAPYMAAVKADILRLGLSDSVLLLGNVPHETLPALYQHAALNLFASLTENCPNILLEMMAANRPALVSRYGPMPEIAGDTVTYFDPMNYEDFVQAWLSLIRQPEEALRKAQLAHAKAASYRWEDCIQATYRAIAEMVGA